MRLLQLLSPFSSLQLRPVCKISYLISAVQLQQIYGAIQQANELLEWQTSLNLIVKPENKHCFIYFYLKKQHESKGPTAGGKFQNKFNVPNMFAHRFSLNTVNKIRNKKIKKKRSLALTYAGKFCSLNLKSIICWSKEIENRRPVML